MIPLTLRVAIAMLRRQMTAAPPISIPVIGWSSTAQSRKHPNGIARYRMTCTMPTVLYCMDLAMDAYWAKATHARPKTDR